MARQSEITRRYGSLLLLAVAAATLLLVPGACKLIKARRDLGQMYTYGALSGRVSNIPKGATTYVLIFDADPDDPQLVEWERVQETGLYFMTVACGADYQVVAFADVNGDRRWEPREPVDLVKQVRVEPMADEEVTQPVSLSLRSDISIPSNMLLVVPGDITREETATIGLGEVVTLDAPRFSAEAGKTGYWEPYKFLKTYGLGIFFMETFDPKKIPVLFVYGAEGSPQDWRYIFEHMDRSRFQPWFFHYATGIRLENWSMGLNSLVKRLHARFPFRKLYVVAHSMGGLVARDFILRNTLDDHETYISRFVTISTPWRGHKAARYGVRMPLVVVPSWNDIEPHSSFLASLFQRKLPPGVTYYLIFGYKNNAENDGTVALNSVLALPAQSEAYRVLGLNYDHTAILGAPETLQKLNEYLSE